MKGHFAVAARKRTVINVHSWPYIIITEEEKAVIIGQLEHAGFVVCWRPQVLS